MLAAVARVQGGGVRAEQATWSALCRAVSDVQNLRRWRLLRGSSTHGVSGMSLRRTWLVL